MIKESVPVTHERQVRVLVGALLGRLVNPWRPVIPIWVGAGLLFAGVSNSCLLGELLLKLPHNRRAIPRKSPAGGTRSLDGGSGGGTRSRDGGSDGGRCGM